MFPLAGQVLRRTSPLWPNWRRFLILGLLGVGAYNALLYLSLQTSTPINVTLVASSIPVWMLLIGRLFFGTGISRRQLLGASLSIAGVVLVLCGGQLSVLLQLRLVPGDLYMLLASAAWAYYSWMLARPSTEPPGIRSDWSAFLLAQMAFGLVWSALFAGGEWALNQAQIQWSWALAAALIFIALGPAAAGFFSNLTPLFTALLSGAFLGELPRLYHIGAFALIVGGIVLSSRR